MSRKNDVALRRWFVWFNRHGFGFRAARVEVQIYWYGAPR